MKKTQTIFFLSFLFFLSPDLLVAQHTENWLEKSDPISYAKLYLHTDREFYFKNDTIWFKAYYLDGQSQQLISGFYTMYIDLFDYNGQAILSQVLPLSNGASSGYMAIPQSIEEGNYLIRAFTEFQKCFGEDAFFYKTLNVSEVKNASNLQIYDSTALSPESNMMDVSFLPEGGFLLSDRQNTVGIKAIDKNGKGIDVKGVIVNSKDQVVTFFTTAYKGMGRLFFTPKSGETYSAKIEGNPDFVYEFKNIVPEGIKLEFIRESKNELLFNVASNAESFEEKSYIIAIMHHGKVLLYQEFVHNFKSTQIKINVQNLPAGINRAVLLDKQLNPISERLFFCRNIGINEIKVALNQSVYETRTNVQLEIREDDTLVKNSFSNLSIAVVDENAIRVNGPSVDIRSWLLINSELHGNIETPADFFTDEESISSETKLNLLMLNQGWSNYLWNVIPKNLVAAKFDFNQGIILKGSVKRLFGRKPVIDGNLVIGIMKEDLFRVYETKTDTNGRFLIDSIFFTDTASVFIQARNNKGRLSTQLVLDPVFETNKTISEQHFNTIKSFEDLSVELSRQKYYNDLALKAYIPSKGSIMLQEVSVTADKIEKDDVPFRIYPKPAVSLKINEIDESYPDVLSYLQARVPGVIVSNGQILIRGASSFLLSSAPLFVVDGMPILTDGPDSISGIPLSIPPPFIMDMPMSMIDRIEVYKNANELAIFGMMGSNGVIAIYTKHGIDYDYENPYTMGAISTIVKGYEAYREFYSPKYTAENIDSEKPDNRITLYWNPNIITENGKADVSFFTSDDIANYKIFVEGITSDGKICLGTAEFSVNEYNPEILK